MASVRKLETRLAKLNREIRGNGTHRVHSPLRGPIRKLVVSTLLGFHLGGYVAGPFSTFAAAAPAANLCTGATATASSIYQNDLAGHAPRLLFDGRHDTGWGPRASETTGWVEFDLGRPEQVRRAVIDESYLDRVRGYVLQARRADGTWTELVRGGRVGSMHEVEFPPVIARGFRFEVTKAVTCPGIWEIQLFSSPAPEIGNRRLRTPPGPLANFRSLKYAAMICWSPAVLTGREISFARGSMPREEYDTLYKSFDPKEFDATEWVAALKAGGFKYLVYVPKHCDGFCMWDTKTTDYNIMNSPFGRDVTKELADACRQQGLVFCLYYSIADWYHADYQPPGYLPFGSDYGGQLQTRPDGQRPDFERYVQYMKTQLRELSDLGGPSLAWWFDGNWSPNWTPQRGRDLYAYMRELQPGGLFGNRIGCAFRGNSYVPTWFASEEKSAGDYAVLEVNMPRFNRDIPWEFTRPAYSTYSWNAGAIRDIGLWKDWLVKSACGDGNFILGVSPSPTGKFAPEMVDNFRRMGHWMDKYGESLYGTRGGPYMRTNWYGSTCKGNTVYLHIFKTDNGTLVLPPLGRKIVEYRLLGGGAVDVKQTDQGVAVSVGQRDMKPLETIVVLKLDGDAVALDPIEERPVNRDAVVKTSGAIQGDGAHGPAMASDGDMSTYWEAEAGAKQAWIEYDLGRDRTFSRALLFEGKEEGQYCRILTYEIQTRVDNAWQTIFTSAGGWREQATPVSVSVPEAIFAPTTARRVRLSISRASDSPIIHEFKLHER